MTTDNIPQIIGIPQQGVPLINENGTMNIVWYRFFISLWQRTGLATPGISLTGTQSLGSPRPKAPAFYVAVLNFPPELVVLDQVTGLELGRVQIT